ncbi:hypothetical protein ACJJTC_001816 [Scirpophaga incertulas]
MAPTILCAGCKQTVQMKENLKCSLCKCAYDLECAGVLKEYYTKSMTLQHKKTWKCQTCICKIPKTGNIDTPIRNPTNISYNLDYCTPTEENNITQRKKTNTLNNYTSCSEDMSFLGDTLYTNTDTEDNLKMLKDTQAKLTIDNFSELLAQRLKENNISIVRELQNIIQTEINRAITKLRLDFDITTKALSTQNEHRKQDIENINKKITELQIENENLRKEIKQLSTQTLQSQKSYTNKDKKIVIYGLADCYGESEYDLCNRLVQLFNDTVNVNLSGNIEDIYRVGKRTLKNRPIVIELLSKRMTKYIVNNSQCFQGTGLFISEFLEINERRERALLREELYKARKKGLHAIIRNNKLYINGKIVQVTENSNRKEQNTYEEKDNELTMNIPTQPCNLNITEEEKSQTFRK